MGLDMSFYSSKKLDNEILYYRNNHRLHRWICKNIKNVENDSIVILSKKDIRLLYNHLSHAVDFLSKTNIHLEGPDEYDDYEPVFSAIKTNEIPFFCGSLINENSKFDPLKVDDLLVEYNVPVSIITDLSQMKRRVKELLTYDKKIYYCPSW